MLMPTEEWMPIMIGIPESIPPKGKLVRFWNEYNNQKWTGYWDELAPEFNVACLWWKETGIERVKDGDGESL